MKKLFLIGGFLFLLSGCSQPLRTLMALGHEQEAQQKLVAQENANFKRLWNDVTRGRLKPGVTQQEILNRYGAPVLEQGRTFLYRRPTEYFATPKVYLDFDEKGILTGISKEDNV